MSFESPSPNTESTQEKAILPFPHATSGIEMYLEEYKDHPERGELLKEAFQEFLQEELENSKIFKSKETGIEMPYTSINIGKIARRIYEKKTGQHIEEKENTPAREIFVFATSPVIEDGDQFTTIEYAMHDYVMGLRTALDKLQKGEPLDNEEIYTVGMPTNVLGKIPPELVENISKQPFDELGKVYGEMIASEVEKTKPKDVELLGMSLGSNLVIRAGENLMDRGIATQDNEVAKEKSMPALHLRTDVPVSLGPSKIKKLQIPAGFIADGAVEFSLPYVRNNILGKEGKEFKQATRERLAEKGMERQMSPDQEKAKKTVIRKIIFSLGNGLEPRKGTKITSTYGLRDMTSVTPGLRHEAKMQKEEHGGSLGQNIVSRTRDDERRFTADTLHLAPWFRENELRRMNALAETIESLKA